MRPTRRLIARALIPLLAVAFALGIAAPAGHAVSPAQTAPSTDAITTIDIDQTGVLLITGLLLPLFVGLITKSTASSKLKALTNFVCAGIAAFITNATTADGHAVFSLAQLRDWVIVFGISTVTYLGLAKPIDLTAKLAPNRGLGRT